MSVRWPAEGVVYTETVVHTPPERFAADSPYQLAIIEADGGERFTVRIALPSSGERAAIGGPVFFMEERNGVAYYRLAHP